MTYKLRAAQYGTPYLQLSDGMYGPLIIHGLATADYDINLGPVFLTDWFHKSAFIVWAESAMYGGFPVRPRANAPNRLINGTKVFLCDESDDSACLGTGKSSEAIIQKGKKYRLRLLDAQTDGWMKISIDGRKRTVIAEDLVLIVPYTTDGVILASGQRYDVVFEANEDVGNY
ncbi:multicopper oxidase-domain-containing protein [Penicillium paradoxum]|uniref:multicopper oxidase-domain-containing protein n=1 Tax=Penicillium paradoxum TaxID=176176 RepID=UPI002547DD25|nr:multicopper oxidase-domain-containing protein [Penicillium paradoxum]KAJ5773838.1 multicopper oxidase-domain-containing protein [Penicillium paradoxum]